MDATIRAELDQTWEAFAKERLINAFGRAEMAG